MKPDVIPGYPEPSDAEIKLFQRNNRLVPDGLIGPLTRAKIWQKPHHEPRGSYTILAPHRLVRGGASADRARMRAHLEALVCERPGGAPIEIDHLLVCADLVSSEWKTGLGCLFCQDGFTAGFRRLASSTAAKWVRDYRAPLAKHLPREHLDAMERYHRQPHNGAPLDDPDLRAGWLLAMADDDVQQTTVEEWFVRMCALLDKHTWLRSSREIVLAARIYNSGSGLVSRYVNKYGRSYDALCRGYRQRGGRGAARIGRIEALVADETWR